MAQIYISLGSNIEKERYVKKGLVAIATAFNVPFEKLTLSSLFESEAVGFNGATFYNMVIGLSCSHTLSEVATILRTIEFEHGRPQDAKKCSPRSLDLDLLLFDNVIIDQPAQLPRDEITKNAFVLWPLSQIAPNLEHPVLKESYQALWQAFNKTSQQLSIVENCW